MERRVVITGFDVILPKVRNRKDFTQYLKAGIPTYGFLEEMKEAGFLCQVGGKISFLDDLFEEKLSDPELSRSSRCTKLAILCALRAWEDAGIEIDSYELDYDTGTYMGTGMGSLQMLNQKVIPAVDNKRIKRMGSYAIQNVMRSNISAHIGPLLKIGGVSMAYSNACSSGTDSLVDAFYTIKDGRQKRMVVGGVEEDTIDVWALFDTMFVMNRKHNETPTQASRPLSETAGGFIPSGGAGVLILESLESALERSAKIYAEVSSAYFNCGAQTNGGSMSFQNSEAAKDCIQKTLELAEQGPDEIQMINGHFTATKADPSEYKIWIDAFKKYGVELPMVQATKSLFGHTLGAAGIVELCAVLDQMEHGYIHPNINSEDLHPAITELHPEIQNNQSPNLTKDLNCVIKASFGFGDVNSCILLNRYHG